MKRIYKGKSSGYLEHVTGGLNLTWEIREDLPLGESRNELDRDEGKGTASM